MKNKPCMITANFTGVTRHDTMEGIDYLVAPMVMIVEGVLSANAGPLYYPANEIAKTPKHFLYIKGTGEGYRKGDKFMGISSPKTNSTGTVTSVANNSAACSVATLLRNKPVTILVAR